MGRGISGNAGQDRIMKISHTTLALIAVAAGVLGQEPVRFDHKVRNQFFAGFAGNAAALGEAMKIAEATLAAEPNHAEAMVWQGGGLFFQSGALFQKGDMQGAMVMMQKGTGMMDKAVELAPKNVAVRIPRGSAYLAASKGMPPEMGQPLLEKGVKDYEDCWEMQKGDLSEFSQHGLGELLVGMAEGYGRLGKTEKAKAYFELARTKLAGTVYATRAEKWLAEGKLSARDSNCMGCHIGSPKVK
jgi:tetratricopeptide (TPR) repeat protein